MVESNILNFIKTFNNSAEAKFLLAVSGGVDSMVLMHIMSKHCNIEVVHVNHLMRGKESDDDETLVKKTCEEKKIPFHSICLPEEFKTNGNFQAKARKFRYDYFTDIIQNKNLDAIVTAHHKDDTIETALLNIVRGTGLEGLQGIPSINKTLNVIRPMISLSKADIMAYALKNRVEFREDASNEKDKYRRNYIRHHLTPLIDKEFGLEGLHDTVLHAQDYFKQYSFLLNRVINPEIKDNKIKIDKIILESIENPALALFNYAKDFGFNIDHCRNLLENQSGKSIKIQANNFEMIKDRLYILIRKINNYESNYLQINNEGNFPLGQFCVAVKLRKELSRIENFNTPATKKLILSFTNNPFPLNIRLRQDGDSFKPSGMNGRSKKVKKYIIDSKFSTEEKDQLFILEKDNNIIAVIPYRVGEGYAFDNEKSYHLLIELSTNSNSKKLL